MVLGKVSALRCILCCVQQVLLEKILCSTWNSGKKKIKKTLEQCLLEAVWYILNRFCFKQYSMVLGTVSARKLGRGSAY